MTINLTDIAKLFALSGATFAILRVAVGRPLVTQVINPHRPTWFFVAIGFISGSYGLLRAEAKSSDPQVMYALMATLVTEEHASGPVMIAAVGVFNGLVIFGLLAFCWLRMARDPSTFRRAKDRAKVVKYYTGLAGGLDFSTLIRLSKTEGATPEVIATGVNKREIQRRLDELVPYRMANSQLDWWSALAVELHHEMNRMNAVLDKGGQGINRRVLFDVQFGGYLFQYLRPPEIGDDYLFLFGATLSQMEVNTRRFEEHFDLLVQALRNIKANAEKL